jgi:hypothetical protein
MQTETLEYKVTKGQVKSSFDVGNKHVEIRTYKNHKGLVSYAQAGDLDLSGSFGGFSFMMFGDYSKTWAVAPKARATEKNLIATHLEALNKLEEIKAEVKAFYEKENN